MAIGSRAYNEYGQALKTGELTAIPRNKYSFTVSIDTIDKPYKFIRIANVQMPSFTYRSQTINNYNNKSIVQTGIDYTPITLTAYDTKDAAFEEFLKNYARHYVAGPMNEESYVEWLANPNNKGLELRNTNHYIKKMVIERVDGKSLTNKIEIFHPFIANADADTLDYSDSSPTVFRVSFNYEGYNILSSNTALPPQLQKPVETITPLEAGQVLPLEELNKSAIFATEDESITSNKAAIIPVTETTVETFTGTLQGHWPTKLELAPYLTGKGLTSIDKKRAAMLARLARAEEIVALGVDAGDTKFQPGVNQIVTLPNGDRFIAQVPESEIHYTDTDPDDLGAI
jgi:hypothetical protein|tara:strand:- start:892 stop:1920 length:1029 start_codon:yes stop_codon:yes gene_type:complete